MEVSISEQELDRRSKVLIGVIALLQGLGLYWLNYTLDNELWPTGNWSVQAVIGTFLLMIPCCISLSYRSDYPQKKYWSWLAVLTVLFIWIPWYGSYQLNSRNLFNHYFFFIPLSFLLAYISLFFLKAFMREDRWIPSYGALFGFSWHLFLSFILAWIFTFIFWLILLLWGSLFEIVNIDFFKELFKEKWFLYPALSLAFAYAIVMFRTKINAVGALQRILRALISILLPLLLVISVMFVAVLPFTGVSLIWDKGYGSDTIIGLVSLTLFFFNAVYQDAKESPYGPLLNKVVQYSVIVLIALLALSAYGISLRIQQYGLTVERIFVVVLVTIMVCYLLLYIAIMIFRASTWSAYFGKANTVMALLVSVTIVLMFTPILNMSRMSVNSQLARLDQAKVSIDEFDYRFLARNGRYGQKALLALQTREDVKASRVISKRIEVALKDSRRNRRWGYHVAEKPEKIDYKSLISQYPENVEFDVWDFLVKDNYIAAGCLENDCLLLQIDLNNDGEPEYVLFQDQFSQNKYKTTAKFLIKESDGFYKRHYGSRKLDMSFKDLKAAIESNAFTLTQPRWQDLKIGDEVLRSSSINR